MFINHTLSDFINRDDFSNPFKKMANGEKLLEEALSSDFRQTVNNVVSYVNKKKKAYLKALNQRDIESVSRAYFNGLRESIYTDIDGSKASSKEGIKIGDRFLDIYTVHSLSQLPQRMNNVTHDDSISKEGTKFFQGITEPFGLAIPYDHIVNQILFIPGSNNLLMDIKKKREEFHGAGGFGMSNKKAAANIDKWLSMLADDKSSRLVKFHFNVLLLTDNITERDKARTDARTIFTDHDISPYLPKGNALKGIYLQSFFAYSSQLPKRFTFVCEIKLAASLLLPTSSYRSDPDGIWFADRVFNAPLRKDTWDEKKRRIKARNFFIIAPTGEGKSTLSNHICYQYLDQGYKLCINDLGGSYKNLLRLYPNTSTMLEFKQGQPLGINPLRLNGMDRTNVTSEQINFVCETLNLLHFKGQQPGIEMNEHNTCLRKIIASFYQNVEQLDMNTFYKYFEFIHKGKRYEEIGVDPSAFDPYESMGKVLFTLSEFTEGIYSYLFQESDSTFEISPDTNFVYFEFDEAKGDPMLLALLQMYSYQATKKMIWDDKSVRGIQLYDEFAKQLKSPQVAAASEYIAQAIRKQNGACGFIIQTVTQLPKTDTIGSILDNTAVYYILPAGKGHHETAARLSLPQHQRFLLDSIESDFSGKHPYSEVFLKMDNYAQVVRVQLPIEHFYAFQTEGHYYNTMEAYYQKFGSMEMAINEMSKS